MNYDKQIKGATLLIALGLMLMLFGAALSSCRAEGGEHPGVLYANDGKALYRVNPNTGVFTKIGDLRQPSDQPLTITGSMAYDFQQRKLYAFMSGEEIGTHFCEINPQADLRIVSSASEANVNYDIHHNMLLAFSMGEVNAALPLRQIDPLNGNETVVTPPLFGGFNMMISFMDAKGHFWNYERSDLYSQIREDSISFSDPSKSDVPIYGVRGSLQPPGSNPNPTFWPFYTSFSFDPFTGVLFATFTSLDSNYQVLSLGTVDLKTGRPSKVIATYGNDPGWRFNIAWGM